MDAIGQSSPLASPTNVTKPAGLMLVPIYLGLCRTADLDTGHEAAGTLINANLGMAILVSRCPLCRDDDGGRILRVVGLPLPHATAAPPSKSDIEAKG
jgi:hypothetical protein